MKALIRCIRGMPLFGFIAIMIAQSGSGQVREVWMATSSGDELGTHLFASAVDSQGNLVVTGTSNGSYLTIKYDRHNGQELWQARHYVGGSVANAIAIDPVGHVYVSGMVVLSATNSDYGTVKYDGNTGQLIWSTQFNGSGNARDIARAIVVDPHGNPYVTGRSQGAGTGADYVTIKYQGQSGEPFWVVRFNSPNNGDDDSTAVAIDREGNAIVTGNAGTIKYEGQTGQLLWGPIITGSMTRLTVDSRGDVYVSGTTTDGSRLVTYKLNGRNGQLLWAAHFLHPVSGGTRAIVVDSAGDVIVTGGTQISENGRVEKYSGQTGQTLWSTSLRGWCLALAFDNENNVYVTGSSAGGSFPGPIGDFRTVKLDGRTGRLVWQTTYPNSQGRAIVVDDYSNVYVSGDLGTNTATRYLTIKYEQVPPGDVDYDFCVDDRDLLRILDTFGQGGDLPEDVNRDGVVDDKDLLTVLFNLGRGCDE